MTAIVALPWQLDIEISEGGTAPSAPVPLFLHPCIVLRHLHYVGQTWHDLRVVTGGVQFHKSILVYKIPLYTTTYLSSHHKNFITHRP